MKKLSIILAAMLAMTAFAGCQKKDEKKADASKPEAIVEKYLDDQLAMDLGDYEDYFIEDADFDEDEFDVVKDPLSNVPADAEGFVDALGDEVVEKFMEAMYENSEYEIDEVEEDGDEAKVTVILSAPDMNSVEMTEDLFEEYGIDPDMAEDEVSDYADEFTEMLIDIAKDADKAEEEFVYTVVKNDDGEWRISKIKD